MRVLFVGNSHTYFNDMPRTFAELWQSAFGELPEVTMLAYSGRSLQWHSEEYFALRFNLLYGGYDLCVIQQCAHPFPGYEETREGIRTVLRLCRAAGVRPFLYMPWCEQRFPENQEKITLALRRLAEEEQIDVIPVGDVWQTFQRKMPSVSLYWKDGEHASVAGDYLIAATVCMSIAGRTDFTPAPTARDFTHGGDIDFLHPAVCEEPAATRCTVSPEIADAVADAAREVLEKEL